jgi:uncharacterized membrane protein HdeD (DUF308 family)
MTSGSAATPQYGPTGGMGLTQSEEAAEMALNLWWLWLVVGILWIVASLVILQFDQASVTTVGIIIGLMFAVAAVQQFALAAMTDRLRWLWILFGVLFAACAVICFINPKDTFVGLADIAGFLFLTIGVWWLIRAFFEREASSIWWLGLIAGILMIILAFWTGGQFFIHKAYVLLVFAGIWALMQGVTDIVRAFEARRVHNEL